MPRTLTCLTLVAMLAPLPAAPAQTTTAAALRTRLPEITLDEVAFEAALDWLAEQSGLNIHVRWERLADYGITPDRAVSLKARNLPLSQVLWLLMSQAAGADVRLAYRASDGLLVLSTEEDLGREMLTRAYDVRDLLDRAPRFTNATRIDAAAAIQQGATGGSAARPTDANTEDGDEPRAEDPAGEALVRLIGDTIEPDSWESAGGRGRIVFWRGQIVVYNSILVHQRLAGPVTDDE